MTEPILKFYDDSGYEQALEFLAASANHCVKRKINFPDPRQIKLANQSECTIHRGIYLDTETTGLSHQADEVIQICMLPFIYAQDPVSNKHVIIGVYPPYVGFNEPSVPLTQEVIDLTGITMDMLAGQSLDLEKIETLLSKVDFVVAHNASFDRPFTHGISALFADKKWACSLNDVAWRTMGFESLKLSHLASDLGFYFEPHQADKDCLAGLAVLAQVHEDGDSYFQKMMVAANQDSITFRAVYAPFEAKDILKHRGYSWQDGSDGNTKGWETVVSVDQAEDERAWLSSDVYSGKAKFTEKTKNALTRFTIAS